MHGAGRHVRTWLEARAIFSWTSWKLYQSFKVTTQRRAPSSKTMGLGRTVWRKWELGLDIGNSNRNVNPIQSNGKPRGFVAPYWAGTGLHGLGWIGLGI